MPTGQIETYGITGGVKKLNVEDMIYLLTAHDVPLQGTFNTPNSESPSMGPANSRLSVETVDQKKVQWIEDELLPARGTLNGALTSSATTVNVATGQGKNFTVGHVIRVADEFMRVTAVATDALTVTRAFAGSTAAAQVTGAAVVGVGTALEEGTDPGAAKWVDRSGLFNNTQIFGPYLIEVTGSQEAVSDYGVSSERAYQTQKRVKEISIEIEQAALYGRREEDTTNKWRTMGGAAFYIVTNKDATTTTLDEVAVLDGMQDSYDNGGVTDLLVAGGARVRDISAFGSANIRLTRTDRVRGQVVDTYLSPFGEADVLLNRHMRSSDLFGWDSQYVSFGVLRPLTVEPLGKTGDATKDQILCEKTLKFRLEKRHFWLNALA